MNDNLYAHGWIDPDKEDPNKIKLGTRGGKRGGRGGRGGFGNQGGFGRGGHVGQGAPKRGTNPQRGSGTPATARRIPDPPTKKAKLQGDSDRKAWPNANSISKGVATDEDGAVSVLTSARELAIGRFWRDVATEYQDYLDNFRRKGVPEINLQVQTFQQVQDDTYNGPELSLAPASTDTTVTVQGAKTIKNQKKKKAAVMRRCVSKVLELRKEHAERLAKFHAELAVANTGGEQGHLVLMSDIQKEMEEILDTIRDPQKVQMVPHNLV